LRSKDLGGHGIEPIADDLTILISSNEKSSNTTTMMQTRHHAECADVPSCWNHIRRTFSRTFFK